MSCRIYKGSAPAQTVSWPTPEGGPRSAAPSLHHAPQGDLAAGRPSPGGGAEHEAQIEKRVREAHAAGVTEGRRAAGAELEAAIGRVVKSADELSRLKARLRKEAERDLVKLTLAVAQRVLRRELTVDEDALQGVLSAALDRLRLRDVLQVRVHPTHERLVQQTLVQLGSTNLSVIPDSSLQIGDVFFDTSRGTLDASLDSQLREIERGFTDVLAR